MSSLQGTIPVFDAHNPLVAEAARVAWEVRAKAHAPYSSFHVGAALWLSDRGVLVPGVNVENASYGATICAERGAIMRAAAEYGTFACGFLVVASDLEPPASPCGMCLQVLAEFCRPGMPLFLVNKDGIRVEATLGDFLPRAFTAFSVG